MSLATFLTATGRRDGPPFSKGAFLADFPDPADFFDATFHSRSISEENSNNTSFYASPELDALLDAARGEPDTGKRDAMYRRAERILYDDAPWIWDYHQWMTEVTQPYVRAYEPHPVWIRDYTRVWLDLGPSGERVPR
jgi:ABC-type transport system substrate-binding protein